MQITNTNDRLAKLMQVTESAKGSKKASAQNVSNNDSSSFLDKLKGFGAAKSVNTEVPQAVKEVKKPVVQKQNKLNEMLNLNYTREASSKAIAKNFHLGKFVDFVA